MPRFHPREGVAGFAYGMLHGALMPMAMPALVAGQDVIIYAERNTGRTYKLGYTIGINLCGIVRVRHGVLDAQAQPGRCFSRRRLVEPIVVDLEHVHPPARPIAVRGEEEGSLRHVVLQD